jgi:hypothetical protein
VNRQERQHPAERGLLDSGLVVSTIRSSSDLDTAVLVRERFVTIAVPGNPCGVLLCCSVEGSQALAAELTNGVARLRQERGQDNSGS